MRAVTTATAAAVLGIERKALDNILSRLGEDVIPKGRQGVERRIPVALLGELLLTAEIAHRLGGSVREAYALAQQLTRGESTLGSFVRVSADTTSVRTEIDHRLEVAIESVVRRPRGRPPKP